MSIIFEVFNGRHQNQVYFSSSGMSTGIHDCNIRRSIFNDSYLNVPHRFALLWSV